MLLGRCILLLILLPTAVVSLLVSRLSCSPSREATSVSRTSLFAQGQQTIKLEATLDDDKVEALYAWVSRAFAGDERYNNLMLAMLGIFGDMSEDSPIGKMVKDALAMKPPEEKPTGTPFSLRERHSASLGAMGAAQWTGNWMTRPHSLLVVTPFSRVEDWASGLSRGVRRTLKKASLQDFNVTVLPIRGGKPAPHSSLAHFRCVVEHEVRLLGDSPQGFFDALAESVGRYVGTTRMTGEIREYRDSHGKIIAFAHEVKKGRVIRGQWFYATDQASKSYVWFHSVQDLVRRAIEAEDVDVVDLGPSGSDAFTALKEKYGFTSVIDWPAVADYKGPFSSSYGVDGDFGGNPLGAFLRTVKGVDKTQ